MTSTRPNPTRLSAIDSFFVAYQESSGVLMQLGVEVELKGRLARSGVERMLEHIVRRWPPLGQRLRQELFGLSWAGECRTNDMLALADGRESLAEWRNRPIDPFVEPPFQLLWIAEGDTNVLAFRAHHAVVDGEGFFAVCVEAMRTLVSLETTDFTDGQATLRELSLGKAFRNLQELRRSQPSARLAMRDCSPGETSIVERDVPRDASGWLCASAWMRAIHAWNESRGAASTSVISIEVPVSLRRRRDGGIRTGNWISPLTLYGDATHPLEALAADLKQQMSRAMRQRMHLALPLLSSPAKSLPWPVFRKLATNPELTGVATSHFAWFEQSRTIHDDVFRHSGGALQIVDQRIYTPVCLHMGAAMSVLAWPERAQMFITHRLTALSTDDANVLADLAVRELGQRYLSRQQVAV
ncbi:MAG TPA: hypothetical protein VFB65_14900 [Pyrinomonadaceae bacterium]|nr:hypothetical protein [Pyrinomonadaceae bacterium]